jgi:hypothetical protein
MCLARSEVEHTASKCERDQNASIQSVTGFTGAGMDEGMLKSGTVNLAPAPSFDAAAQQAIASANPANATAVNVYFTLVLTGYDAVVSLLKPFS